MVQMASLPVLLKQLKLSAMAGLWENYLDQALQKGWNPAQYLTALCEEEVNQRYSRRIAGYFKEAKLPVGKTLSSFDFRCLSDIEARGKIEAMAFDTSWVKRAENILFWDPAVLGRAT